ncbi:MAG: metallophosphoesterase family protein [Fibrobacter sp.]|nr:metallophosphoesterase family protein [Fibrobacter sp.]
MIYGIFSDIHANLSALEAVENSMAEHGVERRVCLGDLVGYCADVEECVQLTAKISDICVMGNHDSVAVKRESSMHFNQYARYVIEWTQQNLSESAINYLKSLAYMVEEGDICFVHASPKSPADWYYIASLDEAMDAFEFFTTKYCFVGHTHNPVIVALDDGFPQVIEEDFYQVQGSERLLINVGSVGQPRDRDARASWCLFDSEKETIRIVRVEYDISITQKNMRKRDFPIFLIKRLAEGR